MEERCGCRACDPWSLEGDGDRGCHRLGSERAYRLHGKTGIDIRVTGWESVVEARQRGQSGAFFVVVSPLITMDTDNSKGHPGPESSGGAGAAHSGLRLEVGDLRDFTYRKKNGELRRYRVTVGRVQGSQFSGLCSRTGRILHNLRMDNIVEFHPVEEASEAEAHSGAQDKSPGQQGLS